ncbi:unnamed protein product [Soboliphyme baturini]|uniref:AAA_23 domain-containing protein n=1 Tax=Soboliphyme baturini TaxID=241478 RepID=A0A183J4B1_9BILA|nr:unnamed protein product [Soboliphyme baturini]
MPAKRRKKQKSDIQVKKRRTDGRSDPESCPFCCGTLKRMVLKNFLCHPKLDFSFGPMVNFITGRNGTGKSAVMAGMVVGLGGRASVMNRGQALRCYIRNGCSSATISITIANAGSDAFKPDVYGAEIVVERKIFLTGASAYRLMSADGTYPD